MTEREPNENSNERMADRPPRDDTDLDPTTIAVDDTAPECAQSAAIDDV